MAWSGLVKDTLVSDGATTVEATPMTFMHNDRFVNTIHADDFIATGSARLGLIERHHGKQLPLKIAGNNWTTQ